MKFNTINSIDNRSDTALYEKIDRNELLKKYSNVRSFTEKICEPLETEDYLIQTMQDVSPTKWHLAHTTWFWEAFILKKIIKDYKSPKDIYDYFFNSYYVQVGERWSRPHRGLLSRPTVREVYAYRSYVDERMLELLSKLNDSDLQKISVTINTGLNHEQQHQELMLTDIKHVFAFNPLYPVYSDGKKNDRDPLPTLEWQTFKGGLVDIGYNGSSFFYDNEKPFHKVFLNPFQISSRHVTNSEYIEFIENGGYSNIPLWLSEGAYTVEQDSWTTPLYWKKEGNDWYHYTLQGYKKVNPNESVCHVSFYEAEAYAHRADARLPTEFEWEHAAKNLTIEGNFVDDKNFHPVVSKAGKGPRQMYGDVWEWTRSDYAPYPGYKVPPGAIGEYNGKFMSGQYVLRGGSCATAKNHIRNTYRNFFPPEARWQFTGIRLAKDIKE